MNEIERVADAFGVSTDLMLSRSRPDAVAYARFALCRIMADRHMSASEIGRVLKRDTSSVFHALRRHQTLLEVSAFYRTRFEQASGRANVSKVEWNLDGTPKSPGVYLVAVAESESTTTAAWDGHLWHSVYSVRAWAPMPTRPNLVVNKTETERK